jgi:hypothetical protein
VDSVVRSEIKLLEYSSYALKSFSSSNIAPGV